MKKFLFYSMTCLMIIMLGSQAAHAQDFCKTDPSFTKILKDSTTMTIIEVTFEPGKKTNMHTHPASFNYVLEGGALEIEYADGSKETVEFKSGDYIHLAPEKPHRTMNIGKKPVKILLIEFKNQPYMTEAKMKK